MTIETAQFLEAAAHYEPPKETRWMWCPNPRHGARTDFVRVDAVTWRCPDCGQVVIVRAG